MSQFETVVTPVCNSLQQQPKSPDLFRKIHGLPIPVVGAEDNLMVNRLQLQWKFLNGESSYGAVPAL